MCIDDSFKVQQGLIKWFWVYSSKGNFPFAASRVFDGFDSWFRTVGTTWAEVFKASIFSPIKEDCAIACLGHPNELFCPERCYGCYNFRCG